VGYVTVTLVTFDKQSKARRMTVESKSNRSSNRCSNPIETQLLDQTSRGIESPQRKRRLML